MSQFTDMPGFNRNNPFVIFLHQAKATLDQTYLELVRSIVGMAMMGVTLIIITIFLKLVQFTFPIGEAFPLKALNGCIIMDSIMQLVIYYQSTRIIKNPIHLTIKKLMEREVSEVAVMNNEELYNTSHQVYRLIGQGESLTKFVNKMTWFQLGAYFFTFIVAFVY